MSDHQEMHEQLEQIRVALHQMASEAQVATLVGQRVFGIALGYEDLNDHDELRHDPMMAVLAGKLEARRGRRTSMAEVAGVPNHNGCAGAIWQPSPPFF